MSGSGSGETAGAADRRWTVDRMEGDLVVVELEDGRMLDLPSAILPPHLREGDVIRVRSEVTEDGARRLTLAVDREATQAAKRAAAAILSRLQTGDPGGDVAL